MPTALHHPLDDAARRRADHVAVEDATGTTTYGQLAALSDRLRDRLHALGVRPGDRVGIYLRKSIDSVASILGALKAGAAYVPVDPDAPVSRNAYILGNCSVKAAVVEGRFEADLRAELEAAGQGPVLLTVPESGGGHGLARALDALDAGGRAAVAETARPAADDLAYILYTSGSTGRPKGVMHTHGSATSFVQWAAETIRPTPEDRFSSHAPFHFDLSILDLYVPLVAGATIVLVDEQLGKDPRRLAPLIAEKRISVWYSVPSILALLAEYGDLDRHDYGALRTVLFAGEVFPVRQLHALMRHWPGRAYMNLFGPTETNVCTFYRVPDEIDPDRQAPYPIGAPCSNVRALVLDEQQRAVWDGQEGVLHIHASGPVMKGYWDQEEMTARVFHTDSTGERWYCTGDVVTFDGNGDFLFLGRRDRMVKRRGYRIELGEIEAALYRHPSVREAAAVAVEEEEGVAIVAFLSLEEGQKGSVIAMKRYSMEALPPYMIPDRFTFLEKLPRTSTDKIDYQALIGAGRPFTGPGSGR